MTTNRRKPSNNNDQPDALELLHAEHVELLEMFGKLSDADARHQRAAEQKLAAAVCKALRRHSQIEGEFFYPALRASSGLDVDLVDAARVEPEHSMSSFSSYRTPIRVAASIGARSTR